MKVRLHISYDGTDFGGWQRQKTGKPTVQACIEQALSKIFDERIAICGAGRTDAGVHALDQVAHFRPPKDPTNYNLVAGINGLTPDGVSIHSAWTAPDDFHAIASAEKKTYKYLILNTPTPDPLRLRYCFWMRKPLDLALLNAYSEFLVKKQDFKSFQTNGTDVPDTIREIFEAGWQAKEDGKILEFTITGDGFLKQMVRNIIGTQLQLEYMGAEPAKIQEILMAYDRTKAFGTASPEGLYLQSIQYPSELDNKCRKL